MQNKMMSLFLVLLLIFSVPIMLIYGLSQFGVIGVINPGFEGAKAHGYGVNLLFDNENFIYLYQNAGTTPTLYDDYPDRISWVGSHTPNNLMLEWRTGNIGFPYVGTRHKPNLGIEIESNIQLQEIDRQGVPLDLRDLDLTEDSIGADSALDGRRVEYYAGWAKAIEETEEKITYEYSITKETFLLVPAEFWISFYLVPDQDDADTSSGWREGSYENVQVWFMLDFHEWDQAYADEWLDDPEIDMYIPFWGGQVANRDKSSDYRGGFPISAWIQEWEKAGYSSDTGAGEVYSPVWLDVRGKETSDYTINQLANLRDTLLSNVRFLPELKGQHLSLYNSPTKDFAYKSDLYDGSLSNAEVLTNTLTTPDSTMHETMFFPINIVNFGTHVSGSIFDGWRVYYPNANFRIRIIYGVYGTFTYLWTEEVTKDPIIDYPDEIELHGTIIIDQPTALSSFLDVVGSFLTSPLGVFIAFLSLVMIIFVILALSGALPAIIYLLATLVGAKKKKGGG